MRSLTRKNLPLLFYFAISSYVPLSAKSNFERIDLTKYPAYVYSGYDENLTQPGVNLADTKWKKIPEVAGGNRPLRLRELGLQDMPSRKFLSPFAEKPKHFTVVFPFQLSEAQYEYKRAIGIVFASLGVNWEVFLNGVSLERHFYTLDDGSIVMHKQVRNWIFQADKSLLKKGENRLVVHIYGDPTQIDTGFYQGEPYALDDLENLQSEKSEIIIIALITLYLFAGLYHLLLYVRRTQDFHNLSFGLFAIGLFIYQVTRLNSVFLLMENTLLISRIELVVLFNISWLLLWFFDSLLLQKLTWFTKGYAIFTGVLSVMVGTMPAVQLNDVLRIWQMSALYPFAYSIVLFLRDIRINWKFHADRYRREEKRHPRAKGFLHTISQTPGGNILIGMLVLVASAVFDILDSAFFSLGLKIAPYGFFIFIIGLAGMLANRFLTVYNQVEELNENLERKVTERTAQLQKTLGEVQVLKERQDGDYFLTSILIQPLTVNRVDDSNVKVEFLLDQKKKFKFRQWAKEIGGDICIADSITLRERSYTVFINADAMGKSIQGAGGVLVLGSVFQSILERTRFSQDLRSYFPERWLKTSFSDMNTIFNSFDGSMLMSMVFGLVDNTTGFLYFINAEHPWTVLYRDQRAEFIESELSHRKLGMIGVSEQQLKIQTFQLLPGDVIIIGSDGRDDIVISEDDQGNRVINEDETLFLRNVEKAEGKLSAMYNAICEWGELSDDLSLLRISFREETAETDTITVSADSENSILRVLDEIRVNLSEGNSAMALQNLTDMIEKYPQHHMVVHEAVRIFSKRHEFAKAADVAEKYANHHPADKEMIYIAAFCRKKQREYQKAADLSERLRMREPHLLKNLLNLADVYVKMNRYERASQIVHEALKVEKFNERALTLRKIIQRKMNLGELIED